MNRTQLTLDAATARRLAVEASVEPRSLLKLLRGEPVRGLAGQRAREVLERYGLLPETETALGLRPKSPRGDRQ